MSSVMQRTISVSEAADHLGITTEEAYELVFALELRTVESETGRRVVPIDALDDYTEQKAASSA
jgi:hypothetical protein